MTFAKSRARMYLVRDGTLFRRAWMPANVVTAPPRLVRVQDRLTRDADAVWRINPRTGFLESRAGLSWTGVREYRTPQGLLRVLRRPEQVNSAGHLKTLRRLPCCEGHPDGGTDVTAANVDRLGVGWTGDAITIEDLGGYPRPVGDISVSRLATIAKMVDAETWREYCERFPDITKGVHHDGSPARTGTSLGYNALWYGPYVDSEIVSERDDGSLVGEWQGPNGPEQYDVEHIVDPECEVVQQLARNTGFDPSLLGGNHEAVCLAALAGRGAEQSELMRVVDSAELPIVGDLARRLTRVALQVPRMPASTRDEKWTVGMSRDLDVVPGDWDGDKAAASVFQWAGFNEDEPQPDPAKARQAFLIYDADAPELKGSYKLPIAEYRDGGLVVVKGGMDAAASYLPQTNAPQEILDRARDVLDHYYAKWEEQGAAAARDALPQRENKMTTKINVEIGIGRDNAKAFGRLAPQRRPPETLVLTLDESPEQKALMGKLAEMQEMFGDLIEMVGTAKGEAAAAESKMADMMPVAEAQAKVDEIKAALAEAEKALAESKAAEESAAAERDAAKKTCDALLSELAPMRAAEFKRFQDEAVARGFDAEGVKQCKDAAELRRAIVVAKVGERYGKTRDDAKEYVLGDDLVQAAFDGVWAASAPAQQPAKPPAPTPTNDGAASQTFGNFPRLVLQRDAGTPNNEPAPTNTAAQTKAGMACLG